MPGPIPKTIRFPYVRHEVGVRIPRDTDAAGPIRFLRMEDIDLEGHTRVIASGKIRR